jgi:hypothetical protein
MNLAGVVRGQIAAGGAGGFAEGKGVGRIECQQNAAQGVTAGTIGAKIKVGHSNVLQAGG